MSCMSLVLPLKRRGKKTLFSRPDGFKARTCTDVRRSSLQETYELLRLFEQTATTAHSKFHTEKAEANPAIFHAEGSSNGYEQARHAIERDLKHVMRSHTGQEGSVTFSIHYSDVNGLSKLENYILGLEIGKYFGEYLTCPLIVACAFSS